MALTDIVAALRQTVAPTPDAAAFIHDLAFERIPAEVRRHARRSLLDLIGVAAGGRATESAAIVADHVAAHSGAGSLGARLLFDGRRVSVPGAAMANAAAIDSLDAHDGHRLTKGHAGVVALPALLAFSDEVAPCDGREFLTRLVLGHEIALRTGIALHASASEYHSSGAWNAIGAAAVGARALRLDRKATEHALGAAEYYGPRSPMMRCIDFPTMVKDGATYGAHVGVTAALLAARGFTGAPAETVELEAGEEVWSDLGVRWRIAEQYLKPWPVCRWAQPAIEAAAQIRDAIGGRAIARVVVETFQEATRLSTRRPETTEAAQYSLPFSLAAMLVHGRVDARTVTEGLADGAVLALADRVEMNVSPTLNSAFPARRGARLVVVLDDGSVFETGAVEARGDPETPLSDSDLINKFLELAGPRIGRRRAIEIAETVARVERLPETASLIDLLARPGAD